MQLILAQSLQIDRKMITVNKDINKYNSFSYIEHLNRNDVRPVLPNANSTNGGWRVCRSHAHQYQTEKIAVISNANLV